MGCGKICGVFRRGTQPVRGCGEGSVGEGGSGKICGFLRRGTQSVRGCGEGSVGEGEEINLWAVERLLGCG